MEGTGKLYYGIKEVADRFGINASKLRYYEKEFPTLQPKKNRAGDRVYTQADIDHLAEILDLIDRQKYTLPGAREFLKERDARRRENAKYVAKLQKLKSFLEQIRDGLDKPEPAQAVQNPGSDAGDSTN
ncbi:MULTISPECIES: MerR family transcriptional regulator [Spirosoma]|uniref:MerR family transcriptional regulator n=1 Tax=Spirosoma liriopis TaxID=2937440 RepID=A0ABT0HRI7_9BACT|nr:MULTISPECIES: MerR family transcriptional regulator [Spirosoma]MCK8494135.1 MerR family transcriptional regulator [Spirosoma liriopis]UHG89151.1 MerR family transcriptional regulator [Spirosoma oryzicola]